ncbi:DNA mismatch repair protein mutS [Pyrenophora teres f. maculata]|nr:DNA mismatch repair protein mutS [Pyrenophora teres f. maculata]
MPRKLPFKQPYRHRGSRSSAASYSNRNSNRTVTSRLTSSFNVARRPSITPSASTSRSHIQVQDGPLPHETSINTRSETQDEINGNDDTLNETVMVVDLTQRGTVGCCYYVARDEKMYFMEDIQCGDVDIVESLKTFIEPTVILVSTKVDDKVIECFDPEARSGESSSGDNDQFRLPYLLEVRPPSEFYYESARTKLLSLRLGEENGTRVRFNVPGELPVANHHEEESFVGQQGQLLRLAGWIDLESRSTVGCAGALISYLQRRCAASYLPGDHTAHLMFRIATLEMFTIRETMFINSDTLHSLQIMGAESHPHSHNKGPTKASSGEKEGLSVYGLFHHLARTPQGRFLLRQQFLRPSLNLDIINERLNTVGNLKNIGNMRVVMINLRKGVGGSTKGAGGFSKSIWTSIRAFAFHALKIKDTLQEVLGGELVVIKNKVLTTFEGYHLAQIGRKISETIDLKSSAEQGRTVIMPGVDEELDQMKLTLDSLDDFLNQVARKLSERMPSDLRATLNVIYFPQIGFLCTTPVDPETGTAVYDGSFDNPWERMFSTEEQVYFKNSETREMDDHFGDVYGIISDREIEISHELAQYLLQYQELLTSCSDVCGELDSLLALAQGAKRYKLCRPRMTYENIIHIKGGRHILQELTVSSFIANDTILRGGEGDLAHAEASAQRYGAESQPFTSSSNRHTYVHKDNPSMLVLTGPNYSGKSVYLKQVALIVYMAHIGSFVPADSAKIGITDKILSRVTTRETVSRIQSAFMIDLQQISLALSLATRRSLLIIDEFGKGTETSDGAGLACAVMEHLLNLGSERPKVIGTTHFHEIFERGLLKPRPALAFGYLECEVKTLSPHAAKCQKMKPPNLKKQQEQIARDFLEADVYEDPKTTLADILTISTTTDSRS